MSTKMKQSRVYISFSVNAMRPVQNEIFISFCADSRHIFSFCVDVMRSVVND